MNYKLECEKLNETVKLVKSGGFDIFIVEYDFIIYATLIVCNAKTADDAWEQAYNILKCKN